MRSPGLTKRSLYWICQVGGWLFMVGLNVLFLGLDESIKRPPQLGSYFLLFVLGVGYSHLYRYLIVRADLLRMNRLLLIPIVLICTVVFSALLILSQMFLEDLLGWKNFRVTEMDFLPILVNVINLTFVFIFWTLIYFLVHYFENYRKAEIENLKWAASINEIELNKLKSQLNPHFIFNSMNSIRALVDENPLKAKDSINQLSNILRNTLLMGKNKVISFDEEMKIVKDYLALEATRFEERLKVEYNIASGSERFEVPPLMVQTLVENGIKHGISKLPSGGKISVSSEVAPGKMLIRIINSGTLNGHHSDTGFGIKSTVQRLTLLYGDKGSFTLKEDAANGVVISTVVVPDSKIL